jgi:hypothetical protein
MSRSTNTPAKDGLLDTLNVTGIIKSVIQPRRDDNSYYVVQFDSPLDLQETGAATPSGFILGATHTRNSLPMGRFRH